MRDYLGMTPSCGSGRRWRIPRPTHERPHVEGVVGLRATLWDLAARDLFAEWDVDGPVLGRVATGFDFTEGPVWVPHLPGGPGLLFSDIPADTIYVWRAGEAGGVQVWRRPSGHSNGLTLDRAGRLLACEHHRRRVTRTSLRGGQAFGEEPVTLADRHEGRRLNSPNDIVVRTDGTIYFTDPTYGLRDDYGASAAAHEAQALRRVYRLPPELVSAAPEVPEPGVPAVPLAPVVAAEGFTQPNGLVFSPDQHVLYVGDSEEGVLRAFNVGADGALSALRMVHRFDTAFGAGAVDGMRADADGRIWTTGPGGVWVLSARGEPLVQIAFPEVTANLAFGEADGRALFVTATHSVYRLKLTVRGVEGRA